MDIVTTPDILVLAASRTLAIPEVAGFSARTIPALEADAVAQGLEFTGPWIFVSHNLPQDAVSTFQLQLCRTIAAAEGYAGSHKIFTLPAFACATLMYEGPLSDIFAGGYTPLLGSLLEQDIPITGEIREVYHQWTDPASPDNRVEIQVGIVEAMDSGNDAPGHNVSSTDI